jgi:hypothetical protein
MGRRTKLTKAVIKGICKVIEQGNYAITACNAVGISKASYHKWIQRGEQEPGTIFSDFRQAIEKSQARLQAKLTKLVATAALDPRNWAAAMTMLERMNPEQFARRTKLEVASTHHLTVEHINTLPPTETLQQIATLLNRLPDNVRQQVIDNKVDNQEPKQIDVEVVDG